MCSDANACVDGDHPRAHRQYKQGIDVHLLNLGEVGDQAIDAEDGLNEGVLVGDRRTTKSIEELLRANLLPPVPIIGETTCPRRLV